MVPGLELLVQDEPGDAMDDATSDVIGFTPLEGLTGFKALSQNTFAQPSIVAGIRSLTLAKTDVNWAVLYAAPVFGQMAKSADETP